MESQKISLSFGIVAIAFLLIFYIVISEYNAKRVNDFKDYASNITSLVKQKNNKIRMLSYRLVVKDRQIQDLKNTLAETRNDLDTISRKLAPSAAPVAAEPAPAAK